MDVAGTRPHTVVSGGPLELAVMWGGFPLLGAGAGWLLAAATGWLARLPWVPFGDLIEWLDRLPEPQATAGTIAVGVLAGLVVAGVGTAERLIVTVDAAQVRLRRSDQNRTIARVDTRVVFVDDGHLVLLDADGAELARRVHGPAGRPAGGGVPGARLGLGRRRPAPGGVPAVGARTCPACPPGRTHCCGPGERAIERGPPRRRPGAAPGAGPRSGWCSATRTKRQYWRLTGRAVTGGAEQPTSPERTPEGR